MSSNVEISDILTIHRDVSALLCIRSTYETKERRFLAQLELRISDFILKYWREQEPQKQELKI